MAQPGGVQARSIYVPNSQVGNNSVTVIDSTTNSVIGSIPDSGTHAAVAITPDGSRAYVANGNGSVIAIDTKTNMVIGAPIVLGGQVYGIAVSPDGTRAYAPSYGGTTVTPIDTKTNFVGTPWTGFVDPQAIAISPDGTRAYIAEDTGVVRIRSTATGLALAPPTGISSTPRDIAVTPDGSRLLVTSWGGGGVVTVIDTATDNVIGSPIPTGVGSLPNGIAISPDGSRAYVALRGGTTVAVVNIQTRVVTGSINVGTGPQGVALMSGGSRAYVTNGGDNNVAVVDTQAGAAVGAPISGGMASPALLAIVPAQAPTASFTSKAGEPGAPSTFNASGSSASDATVSGYAWDFGDGATGSGATPSHTYAKPGVYDVTLTVTDSEGCSTTMIFTGKTAMCNGGPSARATAKLDTLPALNGLAITNKKFAVASTRKKRVKRGTVLKYQLSEAAQMTFTIQRKTSGRKVGSACKKKTRKNRKRKKCELLVAAGSFNANGKPGANETKFSGKIGKRKLKRGSYVVEAVASDAAGGKSSVQKVSFTIVRR